MKIFFLKDYNIWGAALGFYLNDKIDSNIVLNYLINFKSKNTLDILQVINGRRIFNFTHLIIGVYKTYRAFQNKKNIAKEKSIEFLVRLCGRKNIKEAFSVVGINENVKEAILVCCDTDLEKIKSAIFTFKKDLDITEDDCLLDFYENKLAELKSTYNLVTNNIFYEILTRISLIETYS